MTALLPGQKRHVRDHAGAGASVACAHTRAGNRIKDGMKAFLTGGMCIEEMGFRYSARWTARSAVVCGRWLRDVKEQKGPFLLARFDRRRVTASLRPAPTR